jgi:hypothetical protein
MDPPRSISESYSVGTNQVLNVARNNGVLAKDDRPTTTVAAILRRPLYGEIEFSFDGGFVYVPDDGFTGVDSFEYVVSDFRNFSNPTIVQIGVGTDVLTGDLEGSGRIDAVDIDLLASAIHVGTNTYFDLNSDGQLDARDHAFLISEILDTSFGDANLDGRFDSSDLVLVFQAGRFEAPKSADTGWEQGDWNGDGVFDTSDLVAAFQAGGYGDEP